MSSPGLDPSVAELLSAHLDGAVTDEERAVAEQWLERSPEARAEYESLAAVKAALGGMGEVEVPFGFYDRMLRQATPTPEVTSAVDGATPGRARRGRNPWIASGGVLVAAAAAFIVLAGSSETVTPPVSEVAAGDADGIVALRAGGQPVHALRQEADEVRWSALPDGLRATDDGADTWIDLTTDPGESRAVVFRDGVVITLSGEDVDPDDLIDLGIDLAKDQPASNGLLDELTDAAEAIWPF